MRRYAERRREKVEPPVIAGRVPAHSLDQEAAVLAAILLDTDALDKVVGFLKAEHFYSEANGRVYEAAVEVSAKGDPVEIVTVAGWLRDRGRVAQIGGASYLAQLCDATPAVANVATHARAVVDHWRVRQLVATCQRISAEGYGDVGVVQDFIEQATGALEEIRSTGNAKSTDPEHVRTIAQSTFTKLQDHIFNGGGMLGRSTGFARLDAKIAGLHNGDVIVIAGRPSMGKSSLGINIGVNVAAPLPIKNEYGEETGDTMPGLGVLIAELEMPREQLVQRMFCTEARVDLGLIRKGGLLPEHWNRLTDAAGFLSHLPLFIDDTPGMTLAALRAKCKWTARQCELMKTRLGLVVIDYLQLLRGTGREGTPEEIVAGNSQGLKELAKELDVPIIVLAQLNRDVEKRGKNARPIMADLRSSGAVEMDADTIIFVHNEDVASQGAINKGIAELIVGKQRNGGLGKIFMRFDGAYTRFSDLAAADYPSEET